jgi:hypothetical protein
MVFLGFVLEFGLYELRITIQNLSQQIPVWNNSDVKQGEGLMTTGLN